LARITSSISKKTTAQMKGEVMRHVYIHSLNQINEYLDDGQIKNCILLTTENEKVFHMKPEISNNLTNIENSTSLFCSLNHIHSTSYLHLVIDLAILSYQQIFDILCVNTMGSIISCFCNFRIL
jgi:hypothetical protein